MENISIGITIMGKKFIPEREKGEFDKMSLLNNIF